ncbi:MAG: 3-hydroxybutyrate dehydrogenase [Bdellovibrionota bacterium]
MGKVALITGSSSGIGLGIAKAMAAEGCTLIIHGIEEESKLRLQAQEISKQYSNDTFFVSSDLTSESSLKTLMAQVENKYSAVDILINNAGIQHVASIESFSIEKWRQLLEIHLTVPFQLCQWALPKMRAKKWGRIINIASVHGLVASKNKSAYVAAKHGLVGFTKTLALETANSGVTCNAICPGWVRTPLVEAQIEDRVRNEGITFEKAMQALVGEKQPHHSFVTVEQLGAMAVFLCSDNSSSMTGSAITMDGGWLAQ